MVGVAPMHRAEIEVAVAEAPHLRRITWYTDPGLRKLYALIGVICLASATTGYDGSMLNGLQILPVWQDYFGHPQGSMLGLFGSIYSIGSLAGLPFAPYISDYLGRRTAIISGCLILFVGVAVQAAAQNFSMFIAARFFVGFGCSLSQNSAPLLLTELCHPQHRGRVTATYNVLWDIGSIVATWLTFGTFTIKNNWAWRIPSIFQAAPRRSHDVAFHHMRESSSQNFTMSWTSGPFRHESHASRRGDPGISQRHVKDQRCEAKTELLTDLSAKLFIGRNRRWTSSKQGCGCLADAGRGWDGGIISHS